MANNQYRTIRFGVETLSAGAALPRHRHVAGYATVVLAGSFEEASFAGRFTVEPGDVLLHGRFDCHANRALSRRGPQILRLPWDDDAMEGQFRTRDPDGLARLAVRDPILAMQQLKSELHPAPRGLLQWADQLADALRRDSCIALQLWAEREGLAPPTVSRGFRAAFGASPKLFRLESRARRAWNALMRSEASLTCIAHDLGFADLAHMSRSVRALTGFTPSFWRSNPGPAPMPADACPQCGSDGTLDRRPRNCNEVTA